MAANVSHYSVALCSCSPVLLRKLLLAACDETARRTKGIPHAKQRCFFKKRVEKVICTLAKGIKLVVISRLVI